MKQVSNDFVGGNKAPSLRALAPLGIFGLLFANFTICNIASAESVSISVSSASQSFDLIPGSSAVFGKSGDITASITTDYAYGYDFTVSGPDDTQELKSASSHLLSISSATTENNFKTETNTTYNNTWGFLPSKLNSEDNTSYQPAPLNTTPTQIDITTTANPDTVNTYTFAIAARIDNTAVKETYSTTFTLAAVANTMNYSIGFVDATTNMPDTLSGNTSNATVTLPSDKPTKDGYTFKGWCSEYTATGSCSGNVYQPDATYNLSSGAITNLYAIWERSCAGYNLMQDTSWQTQLDAEGSTLTVCDNRDGRKYRVAKMPDGKIWMLDNLAFTGQKADGTWMTSLTSADTNVTSDVSISSSWGWANQSATRTAPLIKSAYIDNYSTKNSKYPTSDNGIANDDNGQADWKFGAYYNYCAAAVNQEDFCRNKTSSATQTEQDICPAGWRLPTGGSSGDFLNMYYKYNGNYTNFRTALKMPLAGSFYGSAISSRGIYGFFWSATRRNDDDTEVYQLSLYAPSTSSIFPQDYRKRHDGLSIRCLAK